MVFYYHELYVYATKFGPLHFKVKSNEPINEDYTI